MEKITKILIAVIIILISVFAGLYLGTRVEAFWGMTVWVIIAGAIGGVVNSLIKDSGFVIPGPEQVGDVTVYQTGYIGNIVIGAVAALVSWGLYGPFATYFIIGGTSTGDFSNVGLTLSAFVGAILVGIGGSQWITKELQGQADKKAAAIILKKNGLDGEAFNILTRSTESALRYAQNLPDLKKP